MLIIGLDEAGYGAIAGPLVVAAVAYPKDAEQPSVQINGRQVLVQDSKKTKAEYLPDLAGKVRETAETWEMHMMSPMEVDAHGGPYEAKLQGLQLVAHRMVERLHIFQGEDREGMVIIDGHVDLDLPFPFEAMPKADELIWQVGAASILAKREQLMFMDIEHTRYSRYAFKKNHGYPTQDHLERLKKYGPCRMHRRSTKALAPWRKKPKGRE